jgi:putative flavoprotein involved in K+ transport
VDGVDHDGHRFVVTAGRDTYEADNVVAATGACRVPKVPAFAPELKASVTQLHSSRYRSQSQLRDGDVLVVGAGNSGAEISLELARTRRVWLAGTPSGEIPFPHGAGAAAFALPLVRFLALHVLNVDTPVGRKAQPKFLHRGAPLVRTKINDLVGAGVERVPRVVGVGDGLPRLADERVLDVANVIWCTGFKTDFTWIHLPVFGEDGRPAQYRGAVTSQPGLYFVGLEFQYAALSGVLPGISRDASYVAKHIAAHSRRSASSQDAAGEYAAVSMPK